MKSNYLLMIFLFLSTLGFAQNFDVGGIVKEQDSGLSIPGVNIQIKNTNKGTTTDFDGKFSLKGVPSGSTILFTFIGFKTVEYKVTANNSSLNIIMKGDAKSLDEVVVIGYGSQKRREVTGAVSVVDSKTLEMLKPVKIEQALQGTVSGVNVTTQSGSPGASLDIRIRGIATNGQNGPTTIIDGYVGELGLLNPNDIESLTVLKDAQAAIYGTIGANGIILVTTKSGKKNSKTKVSYNTYVGFQEAAKSLNLLNATEYALLLNESYANGGKTLPYASVSNLGKGTNWQNEVLSVGVPIINHDMSVSGGSEKMTYSVSGSHLDQEGIVGQSKSGFLRNTARVALTADLSDKLKLKTNVIYTYFDRKTLSENGLGSVLFNALNAPPTLSVRDSNGDFTLVPSTTGLGNEIINPMAQIDNTYNDNNFKKLNGNFGLDYKVTSGLTLSSSMGFNTSNTKSRVFAKEVGYGGKVFDVVRSSVTQGAINDNNYSFDAFATYSKKIEDHNFVATLGSTIFKEWGNGLYATGYDVPNNSWENADISLTTGVLEAKTNSSYSYDERRLSYFGRMQYDFKGKYLLSGMLRRDSSTKFGPGNKIGYFPSFTAGWVISDEGFFGEDKKISFLKLRASYGTLGNDQIKPNGYVSLLAGEATYVFDGSLVNGTAIGQVANADLKWESARKLDIGLDLKLFNNKVSVVVDYFNDVRDDLLIPNIPVSGITGSSAPGASSPTINAGSVSNSGLEFAIDYKNKFTDNFSMSVGYNVTFLKNEVLAVNNGTGFIEGGSFGVGQSAPSRMQAGLPIGYFFGYKTNGLFQNQAEVDASPSQLALGANAAPGDIRYVDVNGDGVINTNDRTNIGDPIPAATMGFNVQMNYKNLDFALYTYASVGNDMVRNYERTLSDANRLTYVLDRWTGEGTSNSVPRVTTGATANNVFSDYFVEDASFLRIQNIQLGYTMNSKITEKVKISKLRFYAGVNNLYTFTNYKGFDPGSSVGPTNSDNVSQSPIGAGIDNGFYPNSRTYLLGLNVNF
ncbi:SusC/RagA family TonB-linked outer membrane protein [Flavobacterium algicola]|uniref:SusC/RagA family TonB-linked outer membrane protein n=1 Tax=Flavobacterium algicola TaxID=556529 RepID=UPI001EFCA6A2|nr:TonB-dependent receptor [Flavobacterium algicola]MCG9791021.1 TonB-dependent receptor [Flavobacterium algicola]